MFIGHFAVAMAAKKFDRSTSLGVLFIAAQWLDLIWPLFLILGIEKADIDPDPHAVFPLIFTDYPYSHSLLAALLWAPILAVIYLMFKKYAKGAIVICLLVISHWALDLFVHIPDLPLTPFTEDKVGLGLWNYKYIELIVELLMFYIGIRMFLSVTVAKNKSGKISFALLVVFLLIVHLANTFGPPPEDIEPVALLGLAQWLLVLWAYQVDKNRAPAHSMLG